jgi:hypothetical protein
MPLWGVEDFKDAAVWQGDIAPSPEGEGSALLPHLSGVQEYLVGLAQPWVA